MRILAVVAGGVLYALALPPFDWAVCGWLTLVPVIWAVRRESLSSAFRLGLLYGYVVGWAATWCFADAATRYFRVAFPIADSALALWYLGVVGVPFGCFTAAVAAIERSPARRFALVLVPAAWVAAELLRGRLLGQPWDLLGYSQHAQLGLIQVAAITGVYGVSFLVVLGNVAITGALAGDDRVPGRRVATLATPAAIIGIAWLGGALATPVAGVPDGSPQVAVVQTNVAPHFVWTRAYTDAQVAAHVRATAAMPDGKALVVWPENSVPRYLEREPLLAVELAALAARHHVDLLFGGPRYENGHTYNAARLITAAGRNGGSYDKHRLVLFAEEKPLALAPAALNDSPEQFTPGTGSGVLRSFVPLGVSICHEIVHPDLIAAAVRDGAELLVNIANDGWLDGGWHVAGAQHLAMAVFRAVETRRFVVRAATTGTSAVIDPYGRLVATQPSDTAGVITASVVGLRGLTPYVQTGDVFALVCVLAVAASLAPRPRRIVLRPRHPTETPVPSSSL